MDELNKQKLLVQLLTDSVKFSKIIHKSLPVVAQLLGSKQNSDILEVQCDLQQNVEYSLRHENKKIFSHNTTKNFFILNTHFFQAIDFFVSAFEFGLLGAMIGVRRMLALIWSQVSKSTLSPVKKFTLKSPLGKDHQGRGGGRLQETLHQRGE